jgi:3',5'-cyclic AMP phosphodiesterase CpdA
MLRIAHVSDLHVLSPLGAEWRQVLFNKRVTSYANLMLRRARVYRRDLLERVLEGARAQADHVVVTGDITNVSLNSEYSDARAHLDAVATGPEVTAVPGNHDIYLPSIAHEGRFWRHFGTFLRSDLPELGVDVPAGRFPCVKLRGAVAFIALSSAVPRPPFVSAGYLGHAQLAALRAVLEHPEVVRRFPVVLVHHDPLDGRSRVAQLSSGLVDARALRAELTVLRRGLVLFGHLHVRRRSTLATAAGALEIISASGASLDHPNPRIRAGFNLYTIDDGGQLSAEAWVADASGLKLEQHPLKGAST